MSPRAIYVTHSNTESMQELVVNRIVNTSIIGVGSNVPVHPTFGDYGCTTHYVEVVTSYGHLNKDEQLEVIHKASSTSCSLACQSGTDEDARQIRAASVLICQICPLCLSRSPRHTQLPARIVATFYLASD